MPSQVASPLAARYAIGPLEVIPGDTLVVMVVYIRRLRVKLAAADPQWTYIHTHHNIGYRLEPEPREEQP